MSGPGPCSGSQNAGAASEPEFLGEEPVDQDALAVCSRQGSEECLFGDMCRQPGQICHSRYSGIVKFAHECNGLRGRRIALRLIYVPFAVYLESCLLHGFEGDVFKGAPV